MIDPLFVDVYPLDGKKDWPAFIAAGSPWHGAIFKLSQGMHYEYASWAYQQRQAFLSSARYGVDLWDGFYCYLDFSSDGTRQIDWFLRLMQQIGGEHAGTLPAMLDVERGGQSVPLTKARVEDVTGSAAARYEQMTGRKATLYGGELLRAINATSLLGCGRSAVALYASELHGRGETTAAFLARTGTSLDHMMLWQYCAADGVATGPAGYPTEAPGCGRVDISALVLPGGIEAVRGLLRGAGNGE